METEELRTRLDNIETRIIQLQEEIKEKKEKEKKQKKRQITIEPTPKYEVKK